MKKLVISGILAATVLVAMSFAVIPVQKAGTVHTGIQSSIDIQDVFADVGSAANTNTNPITVDLLVTRHDGSVITGLTLSAFAATEVVSGTGDTITAFAVTVPNSGSGAYRLSVDPTGNWGLGRHDIAITVTSGSISATALVVVTT